MKVPGFSFKFEPIWILVFSFAPAALGLSFALIVLILKFLILRFLH